MKQTIKYSDERDRSYGLTGMAISMMVLDGMGYINSITMDAPAGERIDFTHDFYFNGNQRVSARLAWNELLHHFELSTAMLVSNLMCRNYVQHRHKLNADIIYAMRKLMREEGNDKCELEEDECDAVFDKTLGYFDRIYTYSQVHDVANRLADAFMTRRTLTVHDLADHLRTLSF